jgi:hypothetical protein
LDKLFKKMFLSHRYASSILSLSDYQDVVRTNGNAFHAMIASLTARAGALDLASQPEDPSKYEAASAEGWIRVSYPRSLKRLAER